LVLTSAFILTFSAKRVTIGFDETVVRNIIYTGRDTILIHESGIAEKVRTV